MPDVSIILPFKNSAEWLPETLQSVLNQKTDGFSFDLILVDDGSTDSSVSICRNLLDASPVKYQLLSAGGVGPSKARNLGWQRSDAAWLQFLDSDDIMHPEKLQIQYRLGQSSSAETAEVYSPWTPLLEVEGKWQVQPGAQLAKKPESPVMLLRSDTFISHCSGLIRRDWIQKIGGYHPDFDGLEDVALQVMLSMQGGKFLADERSEPLFFYRKRQGSYSTEHEHRFKTACLKTIVMVDEYYSRSGTLTPGAATDLAIAYDTITGYFARTDPVRFKEICTRIEKLSPGFVGTGENRVRQLSKILGYKNAHRLAAWYWKLR